MKLWCVTNGFMGNGYVRVYVIAETKKRAKELASQKYKEEAYSDLNLYGKPRYSKRYWTNLEAELMTEDTSKEYVSYTED